MRPLGIFQISCAALVVTLSGFVGPRAAAQTETVLHSFASSEGIAPALGLTFDSAGNLYGVATEGGGANAGTIFELMPSGSNWMEKTLYRFKGGTDGAMPVGSLIFDKSGNLYGTTKLGGTHGVGTAFELSPAGTSWTKKILYNFGVKGDGVFPAAALVIDAAGNLYGTTPGGGSFGNGQVNVGGTVYKLSESGGTWTETVLHSLGSGTDGAVPKGSLVLDSAGNLYGTTFQGGANKSGTVFEVSPQSGGGWKETVLHSFNPINLTDGASPVASLIFDGSGNLYGTTGNGGLYGGGTAFELSPQSGGTWTETVIFNFQYPSSTMWYPNSGLIFDSAGNLYGTCFREFGRLTVLEGGVFKLFQQSGGWTESVLFYFDNTHGALPALGSLVMDSSGNLYGGTSAGGANNNGVVFKVTP